MSARPWTVVPGGVALTVRLTPRGGRDAIGGIEVLADGRSVLKARVRAPASEGEANAGLVRLIMTDDPIELRQWYIVDGSAKEIHVGLDKVEIGIPLSNNLFVTPTPRRTMGRDTHK